MRFSDLGWVFPGFKAKLELAKTINCLRRGHKFVWFDQYVPGFVLFHHDRFARASLRCRRLTPGNELGFTPTFRNGRDRPESRAGEECSAVA